MLVDGIFLDLDNELFSTLMNMSVANNIIQLPNLPKFANFCIQNVCVGSQTYQ